MSYDDETNWKPSPLPQAIKDAAFLEQRRRMQIAVVTAFTAPPPPFSWWAARRSFGR